MASLRLLIGVFEQLGWLVLGILGLEEFPFYEVRNVGMLNNQAQDLSRLKPIACIIVVIEKDDSKFSNSALIHKKEAACKFEPDIKDSVFSLCEILVYTTIVSITTSEMLEEQRSSGFFCNTICRPNEGEGKAFSLSKERL